MVALTRSGQALRRQQALACRVNNCDKGSPLLALPPEIRRMIWKETLGGYNIRILSPFGQNKSFKIELNAYDTPREPDRVAEILHPWTSASNRLLIVGDADLSVQEDKPEDEVTKKRKQKEKEARRLGLNVIGTCRMVREEASLVPFEANTFIFNIVADLEEFVQRITDGGRGEERLGAISTINVDDWHDKYWAEWTKQRGLLATHFTGLRSISIMLAEAKRVDEDSESENLQRFWNATRDLATGNLLADQQMEFDIVLLFHCKLWEKALVGKRESEKSFVVRDTWQKGKPSQGLKQVKDKAQKLSVAEVKQVEQ